jgi:hypothetical protein
MIAKKRRIASKTGISFFHVSWVHELAVQRRSVA